MKIKNAMLIALVLMGSSIFAQQHAKHGTKSGDTQAVEMKEKLSLTDGQFAKVKSINEKFNARFKAVRGDSTLQREKMKGEMKKINDEKQLELKNVLTEQQYTQWQGIKKENKEKRKGKASIVNDDEMKKALSLNDDQYAKVKEINKKYTMRFKTLHKDSTLSRVDARGEMKKLRDEKAVELKHVISDDQYKMLMALTSEQKRKQHAPGMKR